MTREFEHRPAVIAFLGLATGLASASSWLAWLALLLPFAFRLTWPRCLLCIGFAIFGFFMRPMVPLEKTMGWSRGVVHVTELGKRSSATVEAISGFRGKWLIQRLDGAYPGDHLQVLAERRAFSPDQAERFRHLRLSGFLRVDPHELKLLPRSPWTQFLAKVGEVRATLIARAAAMFGADDASLILALSLNQDSLLTAQEEQRLLRSGTYHLVSASGMHIAILALILQSLLSWTGLPRHWQIGCVVLLLLGYTLLCGSGVPTLRAALMWGASQSAYLVRRSRDSLSTLCAIGVGVLIWQPDQLLRPGFQFSFLVSAALVLFVSGDALSGEIQLINWRNSLRTAGVAWLASEPLSAYWFGRATLLSLVANILVAGLASLVFVMSIVALAVGALWPGLGFVIGFATSPPVAAIRILTGQNFLSRELAIQSAWWLIVYYVVALAAWQGSRRRAI